jgi:hypothetical protein
MTVVESYAPAPGSLLNRRWFGLLYLALTTALIYLAFAHWVYDDPFITYSYAQNLVAGNGLVYNPGERILSTTTPLFALLLAALAPLWSDLPHLANLIGAFSLALGAYFIFDLGNTWKQPWVGWAALILYPTFPLLATTISSETPLYLAFCLGAFAFYARSNYKLTAVMAALALLARPDGLLVAVILAVDYLIRLRRPIPWMAVAIYIGISLPWFVFAWFYYGSPLPVTLAAKQHQGAMAISQRFAQGLLTTLRPYIRQWYFWLEAGLATIGLAWMFWKARIWGLLLSWTGAYFLAYTALGVSRYFWYYAPLVSGFVVVIGLGLAAIEVAMNRLLDRFPSSFLKSSFLPTVLLLTVIFGQVQLFWRTSHRIDQRIEAYRAVGEWLNKNTPPSARVGTLEIGAIGYYAQRAMIDFAGLIQPETTAQIRSETTYGDIARWALERYHPEYLVLQDGVFPGIENGYAAQNCRLVQNFPREQFSSPYDLHIYRCLQP